MRKADMTELYRLMRMEGEPVWKAVFVAVFAPMTGLKAEAKYLLMTKRLQTQPDES
jgi:hypothetical protein